MVLVPRSNMPYQVAASAWNGSRLRAAWAGCCPATRRATAVWDALRAFRDEHRSNGPEAIP